MAKLTRKQVDETIERQKQEMQALKKKREEMLIKDVYGSAKNYRLIQQAALQKELELEVGSSQVPHLTDFSDEFSYFDPINIYKDAEMKDLKVDYDDFVNNETKIQDDIPEETIDPENTFAYDGTCEVDDIKPDKNKDSTAVSLPAKAKARLHEIIATNFHRFVPIYDRFVCECCGSPKKISDFYIVYDITCSSRVDRRGNVHTKICKECANKLLAYYYIISDKDLEIAMQKVCASINLYWNIDAFQEARREYEKDGRKGTLLGRYITQVNRNFPGLSFIDSPFLEEGYEKLVVSSDEVDDSVGYDWSKEDYENYKAVMRIVGYDPFGSITEEETRKTLYKDFCSLIDEDLAQDYIKVQSAITIVKSFLKVRQLDEKQTSLQESGGSLAEQKAISDLKKKELDSITNFSASNGWSERFKSKVSKGETSFTGIMKQLSEKKFENALVNKFDIETGATMQQAADYSMAAIMKQLSLSEAEVWKITQEQYQELVKLRRENAKLAEDIRKAKYELAEERLKGQVKEDRL